MPKKKDVYVIDTNIIIDYVDIIPNGEKHIINEPTVDLSDAYVIIPTTVLHELSNFKRELTDRGKAARTALERIRHMFGDLKSNMLDVYNLDDEVSITRGSQIFSVLPVHKDFCRRLPFKPAADDMDGQVILASLAASFRVNNLPIDGSITDKDLHDMPFGTVTLLTNDNELAIRAFACGIKTKSFSYKQPEPYTGRRDLVVPKKLFDKFQDEHFLTYDYWKNVMPEEPPLVANEFLIMTPENNEYPSYFDNNDGLFTHIGRFDVREQKIVRLQYVRDFPCRVSNDGQAIYAEALMDPDIPVVM